MTARYTVGEQVVIVPKFRDGDTFTYRVVEDNGDRLIISPTEWPYRIVPQECVPYYMVTKLED